MGVVAGLFDRREGEGVQRPLAERDGLRLPDRFDFRDLREFLEAISPDSGSTNARRPAEKTIRGLK